MAAEHGDDVVMLLLGRTLRATTEKLDRLRAEAGELLETLLYGQQDDPSLAAVADRPPLVRKCLAQLRRYVPPPPGGDGDFRRGQGGPSLLDKSGEGIDWADPETAYARVAHALSVDEQSLRQPLFEGLVVTGSTEPLGKFAVNAVSLFADTLPATAEAPSAARLSNNEAAITAPEHGDSHAGQWSVDGIVDELTRLLLTDRRTSKVINPALIVADQLIEQGALASASPERQVLGILDRRM
ncbi:hypothetical protein LPJ81_002698 [Coemansia sp. IMI 209127]|nr:hypothetical protein LPJ81_002698 [Coemansia sp. IMI 209127]